MAGRVKRPLGELFGLTNFGVNLTRLAPGAASSLHHRHSRQDELIYVLEGEPTLFADAGEMQLHPVMVAGFAAGGTAHHLENRTERDCVILEIGDRAHGDEGSYPADDIQAAMGEDEKWRFSHKDGRPYWKALAGEVLEREETRSDRSAWRGRTPVRPRNQGAGCSTASVKISGGFTVLETTGHSGCCSVWVPIAMPTVPE
jgi:uncharacterized cupin superfamily protein